MNSLNLPKPKQDFMRQIRNSLEVQVRTSEKSNGSIPWIIVDERAREFEQMQDFFLGKTGKTRELISDAISMRLEIDEFEKGLFETLAQELKDKNPEKKDNIDIAGNRYVERTGEVESGNFTLPSQDKAREKYRTYFGLEKSDFTDPRITELINRHKKAITQNPAKGFGAMTNWISRFPDFTFMIDDHGKGNIEALKQQQLNINHPWVFPDVRMGLTANYLPVMYISAAIDNVHKRDKENVMAGIAESRRAWSNFWKSVMEAHEA